MNINLSKAKSEEIVNITLSKNGFKSDVEAKVNIIMDNSGSMHSLYSNGTVDALVNRALSIGHKFDDDGTIDVFDFGCGNDHRMLKPATQKDFGKYKIKPKGGGTEYFPVLHRMDKFYNESRLSVEKSGGFLGFFQKEVTVETAPAGRDGVEDDYPVFSIFITDGESLRSLQDMSRISKLLSARPKTFVMFVGLENGSSKPNFSLLESLSAANDNADFYNAGDLKQGDQALFEGILSRKAYNVLKG